MALTPCHTKYTIHHFSIITKSTLIFTYVMSDPSSISNSYNKYSVIWHYNVLSMGAGDGTAIQMEESFDLKHVVYALASGLKSPFA